jgi:hypothetical protein
VLAATGGYQHGLRCVVAVGDAGASRAALRMRCPQARLNLITLRAAAQPCMPDRLPSSQPSQPAAAPHHTSEAPSRPPGLVQHRWQSERGLSSEHAWRPRPSEPSAAAGAAAASAKDEPGVLPRNPEVGWCCVCPEVGWCCVGPVSGPGASPPPAAPLITHRRLPATTTLPPRTGRT